jgi:plastocyanin
MRYMILLASGLLVAGVAAGCSGDDSNTVTSPTPTSPAPTSPAPTPTPPGGGTAGATPTTAAVTVGDIFFKSGRNGSSNTAVDTVAVNGTVTWTWASNETLPHSVQSLGSPSFTSSAVQQGPGKTYTFTFTAPGTYNYNCAIHGNLMTGTIVVLAASSTSSSAPMPGTPGYP